MMMGNPCHGDYRKNISKTLNESQSWNFHLGWIGSRRHIAAAQVETRRTPTLTPF